MRKYNVALIGCGKMGEEHIRLIYYADNVNLRYVCDRQLNKARLLQKKYNAEYAICDAMECIRDSKVDIVIIATYPSAHRVLLEKCIENGKHVLCEKPLADSEEDAKKMVCLIKEHPECKVLIGHILRHNETYNRAKSLIDEGVIGSPIIMRMVQNHHTMNWERYKTLICQTSPIIDCGVHYFDVMQWFTGEQIISVGGISQCTSPELPPGKYDYGMVTVRLSGGSVGYYEAGWCNTTASENLKEFIGPKGRIKLIFKEERMQNKEEGDLIELYRFPERTYEIINVDCRKKPTDREFLYLISMIEKNVPAIPTADEALNACKWTFRADTVIKQKGLEASGR